MLNFSLLGYVEVGFLKRYRQMTSKFNSRARNLISSKWIKRYYIVWTTFWGLRDGPHMSAKLLRGALRLRMVTRRVQKNKNVES